MNNTKILTAALSWDEPALKYHLHKTLTKEQLRKLSNDEILNFMDELRNPFLVDSEAAAKINELWMNMSFELARRLDLVVDGNPTKKKKVKPKKGKAKAKPKTKKLTIPKGPKRGKKEDPIDREDRIRTTLRKMYPDNLEYKAAQIIQEHLGVEPEKIIRTAQLKKDLGSDSLDDVELIMAFEEEFNQELLDEVAEKIEKVSDVFDRLKTVEVK